MQVFYFVWHEDFHIHPRCHTNVQVQPVCGCLANPALLIQYAALFPLCVLGAFVEDELTGNTWIYFWVFLSCVFIPYSVFTPTAGSFHGYSQWCSWPSTSVGSALKDSSANYKFHMFGRLSLSLVLITTTSTALTVHGVSGVPTNVERGEACFDINSTSCHMRDLTVFPLWYLQKTLQPVFYGHFNQF